MSTVYVSWLEEEGVMDLEPRGMFEPVNFGCASYLL